MQPLSFLFVAWVHTIEPCPNLVLLTGVFMEEVGAARLSGRSAGPLPVRVKRTKRPAPSLPPAPVFTRSGREVKKPKFELE